MQNFLSTQDWSLDDLNETLDMAQFLKANPMQNHFHDKSVALLFMNPSMRTRTSFEIGVQQLGGIAVVLQPGKDAWPIEFEPGALMVEEAEEHISEVAQVLSRYVDMIGIRAFPSFTDWEKDRQDLTIKALAHHATVPVISMETILHPCQEMAMMMALKEKIGGIKKKKVVVTWTYHPKPLNTAVANSALLINTRFGADVTLLCPTPDYILDKHYMDMATANAKAQGSTLTVSHDIEASYKDADFVYAKSWGQLPLYGQPIKQSLINDQYKHFIVDEEKMALTNNALFSHCLPLRRNVKATDAVMDADYCMAVDEAENRLHVQKAIMMKMMGHTLSDLKN